MLKIKKLISSSYINKYKLNIARILKYSPGLGYPSELMIEPTNYCNAKCPLCPTGFGQLKRKKGFMNFSLYKKIIDEVSGKTTFITLWNYGEPFLHPEIYKMIKYARDHNLYTCVSTNGYVFYKDKDVERLVDSDLDNLIVSLDGATEKIFSIYRKNVNFTKIIKGLKQLKTIKAKRGRKTPNVEIQFIVMKHNEHEIPKMRKLACKLGANLFLKTVNTQMVRGINQSDWLPTNQIFSRYTKNNTGNYVPKKQNFYNCPTIWNSLVINWDGTINPCCYDYQGDVVLGDLTKQTIKDVWKGRKMRDLRKSILSGRRKNIICRNCPVDLSSYSFIKLSDMGNTKVKIKKT